MNLFNDEAAMQKWLSNKFELGDCLADMTINYEDYHEMLPGKYDPLVIRKIKRSFAYCIESFDNHEVISENENISLDSKDTLKPDFILYAPATESMVVLELKNLKNSSRQAGTEIGAYGAEIKSYLPFISDGEIVNVIISSVWPALLKHYIFNEICWLHRNLICLEPVDTVDAIQLHVVDPEVFVQSDMKNALLTRRLSGYQICMYDHKLYQGGAYYRISAYENRMRAALEAMVVRGNALNTHGFAFLWRYRFEIGLAPYNVTVVNFSPFETLQVLLQQKKIPGNKLTKRLQKVMRDHAPDGHGMALESIRDAALPFLKTFCEPQPEGFMTWGELYPNIWEQTDAVAFVGWGIFGELFNDLLAREYEDDADWPADSPLLANKMLSELNYYL